MIARSSLKSETLNEHAMLRILRHFLLQSFLLFSLAIVFGLSTGSFLVGCEWQRFFGGHRAFPDSIYVVENVNQIDITAAGMRRSKMNLVSVAKVPTIRTASDLQIVATPEAPKRVYIACSDFSVTPKLAYSSVNATYFAFDFSNLAKEESLVINLQNVVLEDNLSDVNVSDESSLLQVVIVNETTPIVVATSNDLPDAWVGLSETPEFLLRPHISYENPIELETGFKDKIVESNKSAIIWFIFEKVDMKKPIFRLSFSLGSEPFMYEFKLRPVDYNDYPKSANRELGAYWASTH